MLFEFRNQEAIQKV